MSRDLRSRRVLLQDSHGTTKFVYDNQQYLLQTDGSNAITAAYTQEPGSYSNLTSQHRYNGSLWLPSYHHYDSLGNTAELTDADENVTDTYEYTAWGELVSQTGNTLNPFQWRGKWGYFAVPDTGEVYVIMRTYDPVVGRWTTLDPLRFVDGLNMYLAYFVPDDVDLSGTERWKLPENPDDYPKGGTGPRAEGPILWPEKVDVAPGENYWQDESNLGGCQCGITFPHHRMRPPGIDGKWPPIAGIGWANCEKDTSVLVRYKANCEPSDERHCKCKEKSCWQYTMWKCIARKRSDLKKKDSHPEILNIWVVDDSFKSKHSKCE